MREKRALLTPKSSGLGSQRPVEVNCSRTSFIRLSWCCTCDGYLQSCLHSLVFGPYFTNIRVNSVLGTCEGDPNCTLQLRLGNTLKEIANDKHSNVEFLPRRRRHPPRYCCLLFRPLDVSLPFGRSGLNNFTISTTKAFRN